MNRMKIILVAFLMSIGIGFIGCNTEEINLRVIKEDRHLVSSDSTANKMKWRTTTWSNKHAKYWSSAGVIVTTVDNTLDSSPSPYWLKKIVSKGFKGSIFIEEDFSYLPVSWFSEPSGSYKNDLYMYFASTMANEDWAVKNIYGTNVVIDHPDYGYCFLPNPNTMETVWGAGACDILREHMDNLLTYVGAQAEDFTIGLYVPYRISSWEPHTQYTSIIEQSLCDPLNKTYGISQYTTSDMEEITSLSDSRMLFLKNKGFPVITHGNRLDTNTDRLEDKSIIGHFFEDVSYSNVDEIKTKATTYRSSFVPTNTNESLMLIGGIVDDVYHYDSTLDYARLVRDLIHHGMYFTSGANGNYWEYPEEKPGDWWVRSNNDSNWQNNRNNPTYDDIASSPRPSFNVPQEEAPADVTAPAAPSNLVVTAIDGGNNLDWNNNNEVDFSYYKVYVSTTQNGTYSQLATNVIGSTYNDIVLPANIGVEYWYKIKAVDLNGNISDFSNSDNGTPFDSTPPEIPTLTITNGTYDYDTYISWNLISDAVTYKIYTDDGTGGEIVFIGSNNDEPFNYDTAAFYSEPTTFAYQIASVDAWNNVSERSNIVYFTTSNHLSPGTPTLFSATGVERAINLNWYIPNCCAWVIPSETPPSDFLGYKIYRGTSPDAMSLYGIIPLMTNYSDRNIDVGTTYYYKITTYDNAGNESDPTSTLSAIPIDTQGPSAPTSITFVVGDEQMLLQWINTTDSDVDHVNVYRSTSGGFTPSISNLIGTTSSNSYLDTGLINGLEYYYVLKSVDIYGNIGSSSIEVSEMPVDSTPPPNVAPSAPVGLAATSNLSSGINLTWTENAEVDLSHYNVYRGDASGLGEKINVSNVLTNSYSDTDAGLSQYVTYYYTITAVDTGGLESIKSSEVTGQKIDTTAPVTPTGLTVVVLGDASLYMFWTANTEIDISGYNIYRSTVSNTFTTPLITNNSSIYYNDTTVNNGTTYYYKVSAVDIHGNESSLSTQSSATPLDITAPSVPSNVSLVAGDGTITVNWSASTDSGNNPSGLKEYKVYRGLTSNTGLTPLATVSSGTSYVDNAVTNLTTYYYQVTAIDNNLNSSSKSTVVSTMPQDTTRPSAPTGVIATAGNAQVQLSWNAVVASDLDHYEIMVGVNGGTIVYLTGNGTSTTYTHTGLTNGSTYSYQILAYDEVGPSERSSVVSATPQETVAPNGVTNLRITSQTTGSWSSTNVIVEPSITIAWDATTSPSADQYLVLRGYDSTCDPTIYDSSDKRHMTLIGTLPIGTLSFTDVAYDENTAPLGFINGSPTYYKVVAIDRDPTPDLTSTATLTVSWTPRCVRELPFPFYSAMWYKDISDAVQSLSSAELDSLSTFDGLISSYFEFNNEPARQSIVSQLRTIRNPDLIMYTYVNVQGIRTDWETLPTTTPFRKIWDWCLQNNGFLKDINGAIIQNPIYPTRSMNFANTELADFVAKTWVEAYQSSGMDGEYTGLYLDFLEADFPSWVHSLSSVDADQNHIAYSSDAAERQMYDDFCVDMLSSIRREFAERKMTNRLITVNGNGGFSVSNIASFIDGYQVEYFNKSSSSGAGYVTGDYRFGSQDVANLNTLPQMISQISPPTVLWEAYTDSNQQYMAEPLAMAKNGWVLSNWGFPDLNGTGIAPDSRENGSRAQSISSNIPQSILNGISYPSYTSQTYMKRLPDAGTFNSVSYNVGGASTPDTMVVDYENYDLHLVMGAGGYNIWSYYVETTSDQILRRSPSWPTPYPSTPTGLTATGATNSSLSKYIDLDWSDVTNFGYKNGFGNYKIYRSTVASGLEPSYYATSSTSSYRDTGVTKGVAYRYKVSVVNNRQTQLESSKTSYVDATATDVVAPTITGFNASVGDKFISLTWNPNVDEPVTYVIDVDFWAQPIVDYTQTSYTITGLTNGVSYDVLVYAVDQYGTTGFQVGGTYTPVGVGGTLTFDSGPSLDSVRNSNGYVQFDWSATLGTIANTKSTYYKNSESIPDTSTFDWNTPEKYVNKTVTTTIATPQQDSDTKTTLVWSQSSPPNHYHIERKIDNGAWESLTTSVTGSSIYYTDTTAPRGKVEYRIAAVSGSHGGGETVGSWVTLSEVDDVSSNVVYNESIELKVIIDISEDGSPMVRDSSYPRISIFDAPDITAPSTSITNTVAFDTTNVSNVEIVWTSEALESTQAWFQWKNGSGGTYEPINQTWLPVTPSTTISQTIQTGLSTADLAEQDVYTRFKLIDSSLNESSWVETYQTFHRQSLVVGYKEGITIQGSKIVGNHTNFIWLVTESNLTSNFWSYVKSDGSDIRFTTDVEGFNFIPREIVSINKQTQKIEMWVKVPSLVANTNQTIYCWYGDPNVVEPTVGDASHKYNVWSDYSFVYHMEDDTSSQVLDSTSGKVGSKTGSNQPIVSTGKIGNGQNFGTTGSYAITVPYSSSFDVGSGPATWSLWMSWQQGGKGIISHSNPAVAPPIVGYTWNSNSEQSTSQRVKYAGTYYNIPIGSLVTDTFVMFTCVKSGSTVTIYQNGSLLGSDFNAASVTNYSGPLSIGTEVSYYTSTVRAAPGRGIFDEVKFCRLARSSEWITTEYNNQSNPAAFATAGSALGHDWLPEIAVE